MQRFLSPLLLWLVICLLPAPCFGIDENSALFSSNNRTLEQSGSAKSVTVHAFRPADLLKQSSTGLIYCLAVFLIALALKKRLKGQNKTALNQPIKIISRQTVSPKSSLLLVSVDNQRLLLAQNDHNLSLISELNSFAPYLTASLDQQEDLSEQDQLLAQVVGK